MTRKSLMKNPAACRRTHRPCSAGAPNARCAPARRGGSRSREDGALNQREDIGAHVAHFASSSVLHVEEDPIVRDHILKAVRGATPAQAFANLDALDGAVIHPGRPVLLVLGLSGHSGCPRSGRRPSQGQEGAGALLVVEHSSTALMRIALRSGVNDAIELSQSRPNCLTPWTSSPSASKTSWRLPRSNTPGGPKRGRQAFVTTVFSPKGGVGKSVAAVNLAAALARASGGQSYPGPRPAVRRRGRNAQPAASAHLYRRSFGRRPP